MEAGGCCQIAADFIEVDDPTFKNGIYLTGDFFTIFPDGDVVDSFGFWDGENIQDVGGLFGGSAFDAPGNSDIRGVGRSMTIADIGDGPSIYVGGNFEFADGIDALNIARYDGAQWHAVGAGLGQTPVFDEVFSEVVELAAFDDGSGSALYAAVRMWESANDWVPTTKIARWKVDKWYDVVSSFEGAVHEMAVHDDGSGPALYIAGEFTDLNGVTVNNIARLRFCEPVDCPADVTGDGIVDLADLNLVLANFGQPTSERDTSGDGIVDIFDLNTVLAGFGDGC